tara:strand:+ start:402 stop:830 length:429 start_codon:yes stop_codon:yes gene_type:complete
MFQVQDYYVDAIIDTLKFAKVDFTVCQGKYTFIEFLPNSEHNDQDMSVAIKGTSSIFLTVSRIAHTFPSDPVNAGIIDMNIRWLENATLSDVEHLLSDGRIWLCLEFQESTAADVLLISRLKKFDLSKYPYLSKYRNRIPLK